MHVEFGKTGFIIDDYRVVFYHDYGEPWVALIREGHKSIGIPVTHFHAFLSSFFDERCATLIRELDGGQFSRDRHTVRPISNHLFTTEDPEVFK